MINLIKNEFIKIRLSKIIFSQILLIITLLCIKRYGNKSILELSYNLIPIVSIIICILFGGIISNEIENGSFRYYLTKPYKRWKIYLSKMITIIIYITINILIITIVSSILNHSFDYKYILKFFIYSVPCYFIGFLILYLSLCFKNHAFSVGISIFIVTFSLIISQVFFGFKFNIIEYTFLPYLDFSIFNDNSIDIMNKNLGTNLSLKKGIIIDVLSMFILYFLGNKKFIKKDIKC